MGRAVAAFTADEPQRMVQRLRRCFADEVGKALGRFDGEFLLDFVAREIGMRFDNRGLLDAQAVPAARIDDGGAAHVTVHTARRSAAGVRNAARQCRASGVAHPDRRLNSRADSASIRIVGATYATR